jgi:4-hydroxy-2-oxoglutarate aldolase
MIAGTGIESAHETLRLTEYAAELGYDAAMVRTPHYYKNADAPREPARFLSHRRRPLRAAHHHLQLPAGHRIRHAAEVVIELAGHPNIAAIKESSGNLDKVKQMVEGTRHIRRGRPP